MDSIIYRINTATAGQVHEHLTICDEQFVPHLSKRLQISSYAQKLTSFSTLFEAWYGHQLVGLVAVYMNDAAKQRAFISNVSVLRNFEGRGVASALVMQSLTEAKVRGFSEVVLEVDSENIAARNLYVKRGFITVSNESGIDTMSYKIQ
jgi:ribosomal protein S18 acetylase RimI-like enzyme